MSDKHESAWRRHVELANELAREYKDDSFQSQVVALLMRGSTPISFGVSKRRHARNHSYFYESLHAESDLIRKVDPEKLRGAKIFLYRFQNGPMSPYGNQPLNAKPCHLCAHNCIEYSIRSATYIDNNGCVCTIKRSEMKSLVSNPSLLTEAFIARHLHKGINHEGKFQAEHFVDRGY